MSRLPEWLQFSLSVTAISVVALVIIFGGMNWTLGESCHQTARAYGHASDYGFFQGCVWLDENGKAITSNQVRIIKNGE